MENLILNSWLSLMTDVNQALNYSTGTSMWLDGLEEVKKLSISSFFKPVESRTYEECKALAVLADAHLNASNQNNFWVSAHSCLLQNSPYYKMINSINAGGSIEYRFVKDDLGDFCPWSRISILGRKFYSNVNGQIRIPFYTFNHENTHLLIFKDIYSNLDISDSELYELIVLAEWFCISIDLILAFDLIRKEQIYAFKELCRVPVRQGKGNVFEIYCHRLEEIDQFADKFRNTFLGSAEFTEVFDFISNETLTNHRTFAYECVLVKSRNTPAQMSSLDALQLLFKLKNFSLTDLIKELTGVEYQQHAI